MTDRQRMLSRPTGVFPARVLTAAESGQGHGAGVPQGLHAAMQVPRS